MDLTKFTGAEVSPGQPLTAQAWNEIIAALRAVTTYLVESAASSVRVQITNDGVDLRRIRVLAVAVSGGQVFAAVAPFGEVTEHVFAGLPPGGYTVHAEGPGFKPKLAQVTVPLTETLSLSLTPQGALFGLPLSQVLQTLANRGINVALVLDVVGREVSANSPGADYQDAPVLSQLPVPGEEVPEGFGVQLAVAAPLTVEQSIEVPSLAGLSLAEARKSLESVGLVVGKVETRK